MEFPASVPAEPWGDVPYEQLVKGLRRFLRTDGQHYLDDPNVTSIGLGHKIVGGRPTAELSVQFIVEEKCPSPEALAALGTHPVPEAVTVAGVRVPTDVVERHSQPALAARPQQQVLARPNRARGDGAPARDATSPGRRDGPVTPVVLRSAGPGDARAARRGHAQATRAVL